MPFSIKHNDAPPPTSAAHAIGFRSNGSSGNKILGARENIIQVGLGKSLNMSSSGVLFTTESILLEGQVVELAVSWPALLDNVLPLKLIARGRLVRADGTQAAMAIETYEFKTRGSNGL